MISVNIYSSMKQILILAILIIILAGCTTTKNLNEAQVVSIHTQVAQAIHATRTVQTALETQSHQTIEAEKALTPSPTVSPPAMATDLPTSTLTFTPSSTPTETPTPTASETPTSAYAGAIPENAIIFYLTILGTGGPVGCGDTLVKMTTGRSRTGDIAADLKIALDTLFSVGQYSGGAYNATFPSNLRVDQVNLTLDGTANVILSGSYVKPADGCDASRYRSQVWATALQFKEIVRFIPFVGNSLLGDRLAVYSDSGG